MGLELHLEKLFAQIAGGVDKGGVGGSTGDSILLMLDHAVDDPASTSKMQASAFRCFGHVAINPDCTSLNPTWGIRHPSTTRIHARQLIKPFNRGPVYFRPFGDYMDHDSGGLADCVYK